MNYTQNGISAIAMDAPSSPFPDLTEREYVSIYNQAYARGQGTEADRDRKFRALISAARQRNSDRKKGTAS